LVRASLKIDELRRRSSPNLKLKLPSLGARAQSASELVFGKDVTLQTHGHDKYGRTIADVLLPEGTNVNHTLVKEGWCWWYRKKYAPGDAVLEELEKAAREAKKGLWADRQPVPPWVYRKARRGQALDLSDMEPLDTRKSRGSYAKSDNP
jgi:micrococcal nuclease